MDRRWRRTARARRSETPSRYVLSYCFSLDNFIIVGGRRDAGVVQADRERKRDASVHIPEVERGSSGAGSCSGWPGFACCGSTVGFGCCRQCAVARVRPLRFTYVVISFSRRLNAHLSSIVSSKPFQMPAEVVSRTTSFSGSRLSSFGFSGTIAHGAFESLGRAQAAHNMTNNTASLYR